MSSASTADASVGARGRARGHRIAEALLRFRELGIVVALAIVVTATAIKNPRFVEVSSLQDILAGASIIGLLAIGQTLVIVTRNVDLSCGSVVGLTAYAVGVIFVDHPGVSPAIVFLAAAGIGLACGAVDGAIVTIARVPSLVVTLGTLYVIRGADATWAGGNQINASSLPDWFNEIGFGTFAGVPYLGIILIGAAAVAAYGMRRYRTGRDFYAIGSNPPAARLAGIPVERRIFLTFAISGAVSGVAGALWLSYFGSVDSTAGTGYEFTVIAAVVVGGVAIFGGSGSVVGAVLGAILLQTIASALPSANVSSSWELAIQGALLVGAIALDRVVSVRVAPALRTRRSRRVGA
jgi:rhamnose transport system permease protein